VLDFASGVAFGVQGSIVDALDSNLLESSCSSTLTVESSTLTVDLTVGIFGSNRNFGSNLLVLFGLSIFFDNPRLALGS